MSFTPLPFAPGSYLPVVGSNYITFIGTTTTPYTIQWGVITGVISDGSSSVPGSFSIPFPNQLVSLVCQVATTTNAFSGFSLACEVNNQSLAGFNAVVSGGQATTLVDVYWYAVGY